MCPPSTLCRWLLGGAGVFFCPGETSFGSRTPTPRIVEDAWRPRTHSGDGHGRHGARVHQRGAALGAAPHVAHHHLRMGVGSLPLEATASRDLGAPGNRATFDWTAAREVVDRHPGVAARARLVGRGGEKVEERRHRAQHADFPRRARSRTARRQRARGTPAPTSPRAEHLRERRHGARADDAHLVGRLQGEVDERGGRVDARGGVPRGGAASRARRRSALSRVASRRRASAAATSPSSSASITVATTSSSNGSTASSATTWATTVFSAAAASSSEGVISEDDVYPAAVRRQGLYGPTSGPVGPVRAWCVLDAASGRLPPTAVEVVPSRVLLYDHPSPESLRLGLLSSQCRSRRDCGGDCKTVVACVGGRQAFWSATECPGTWFFWGREKSLSLRHRRGDAHGCGLPS